MVMVMVMAVTVMAVPESEIRIRTRAFRDAATQVRMAPEMNAAREAVSHRVAVRAALREREPKPVASVLLQNLPITVSAIRKEKEKRIANAIRMRSHLASILTRIKY